jgi:hypothetical protein
MYINSICMKLKLNIRYPNLNLLPHFFHVRKCWEINTELSNHILVWPNQQISRGNFHYPVWFILFPALRVVMGAVYCTGRRRGGVSTKAAFRLLPDQTFDILLIGFDVTIRSKNLIPVRSVYWSNSDQKPPYSPIKIFDRGSKITYQLHTKYLSNFHIKYISDPDQFVWSGSCLSKYFLTREVASI